MVASQNKKLNAGREGLKARKAEPEQQIEASQDASITVPKLERCVELMRERLSKLDYETKRMALEMLDITVWIDGYNVEVTGVMPVSDYAIVRPQLDMMAGCRRNQSYVSDDIIRPDRAALRMKKPFELSEKEIIPAETNRMYLNN